MSSDWWLNNIGSIAVATTPRNTVPRYGVALDVGTGPFPNAQVQRDFVAAEAKRAHAAEAARIAAAQKQDDDSWWNRRLNELGHSVKRLVGDNSPVMAVPILGTYLSAAGVGDDSESDAEIEARGAQRLKDFGNAPIIKQTTDAYNFVSNVAETPFIMDKNVGIAKDFGLWTDRSAWGRAWRAADDRTIAQAIMDDILVGTQGVNSEQDLDRIRRTNSLYGMTTFAGDLYAGFKLDPTVFAAKVGGEAHKLATGRLPTESSRLNAEALRVARGERAKRTVNPLTKYASYRGQRIAYRFDDLRDYARTHSLTDMTGLPMFRRQAVNGAQAALAFKLAANDDKLWDLTQRAVLADPVAWRQIAELKHSVPEDVRDFAPGAQTYIDAIEATKTKLSLFEQQADDLEKIIAQREANKPLAGDDVPLERGFYNHYTWSLHRDLDAKKADIDEISRRLEAHEDYGDWLAKMPHAYGDDIYMGPVTTISQVSTKAQSLDYLQHTYQTSPYSAAHRISQVARGAWMMKANPIDLNRVDVGVESIRRQFEQFDHLFQYRNPDGVEASINEFLRAPDQQARWFAAEKVENEHLIPAVAQKFGLKPETVDLFLRETRLRQNEMVNALISGKGAVYSTGSAMDTAKILKREHGMAEVEVVDANGVRETLRVPEEALQPHTRPVDPVQTPNNYMPMDTRQVFLTVKRNNELFEALDHDVRNFGAKHTAKVMNGINDLGTAFNAIWKPIQLFRLAWPQRVIMDESLRHMALVGSNVWFANTGAALRAATLNALNPLEHGYLPWRERRQFKAGPGPLTDNAAGRNIDTPTHEAELETAPVLPAFLTPQVHKERYGKLLERLRLADDVQRTMDRNAAILRDPNSLESLTPYYRDHRRPEDWAEIETALMPDESIIGTPYTYYDLVKAKGRYDLVTDGSGGRTGLRADLENSNLPLAMGVHVSEAENYRAIGPMIGLYGIGGSRRAMLDQAIADGRKEFAKEVAHRKTGAGHGPLFAEPLRKLDHRESQRAMLLARELGAKYAPVRPEGKWYSTGLPTRFLKDELPEAYHGGPLVAAAERLVTTPTLKRRIETLDPVNGTPVRSGFAVPVAEAEWSGHVREFHAFLNQHAELLGSNGYRVQLTRNEVPHGGHRPTFKLEVVRLFRKNDVDKATEFAHHAGADKFLAIHEKQAHYVRDWNDKSPVAEALDRMFHNKEQEVLTPGEAPTRGKPGVYHGTSDGLPDDLLPRTEVPAARGNYAGQGLYTTVSSELGETYNYGGLYTVRGSKSGKVYKTFDLEQSMSRADKDALAEYMLAHYREHAPEVLDDPMGANYDGLWSVNEVEHANTWMDIMSRLEGARIHADNPDAILQPQQLVTKFLEDMRDAGVLMYDGGRLSGGERHQVYVWLHPEDLEVRPAYSKTGKYESLESMLLHPDAPENLVPQNRIHRTGSRHPLLRELETIHNKRTAYEKEFYDRKLRATTREEAEADLFTDPAYDELLAREGELMSKVGANYTHNVTEKRYPGVKQADHWYTITHPDRLPTLDRRAANEGRTDLSPANEEMHGQFNDLDFNVQIDSVHDMFVRKLLKRREFGTGSSVWKSGDGQRIVGNAPFEGPGGAYISLISSNPTYTRLTDTYKRTLSKYRERATGYKSTPPPDVSKEALATSAGRAKAVDYYTSWADLLNEQIRNSPIWFKMLEGKSDEQIIHWLTSTDEGARLRTSLPHMGHRPEKWVEEHRQRLNSYLPDKILQAAAKDRPIKASELRRIPAERMPTIYEPDLQMISGRGEVAKMVSGWVDKVFHALGTVPSDALVRQPFFASMYDLKMRNLVAATDSAELSNAVLRGYERLAREFALRQVKKNLYDLADETNFAQAARFLAPFWGAQQEAMLKWAGIAVEKPETVAKFYVGINQAYQNLTVVDEDGKPTKSPHNLWHYNANDRVILQIPKQLTTMAPFDRMLKEFGSVGIAFGSANTALQGDNPLIPSLGPIVTIPADTLVNAMWDTHGTQFDDNFFYRWLFPVGRSGKGLQGKMEQLFPGWGRRISAIQQGQDSRMYANTFFTVYRELELDHRKRGLPPPTAEEVTKATRWHMGLRVMAAFALPAAMEFRPKHQLFLDEYHKMQELYGPDAFEQFVAKRGADAARYAASSSNSPVGIPPTSQAMEEWTQNKALIEKFPDWGGAIISPDAWADDFSSDAYGAQFDIKLGPDTRKTIRELNDTQVRIDQTDARLGWLDYRQFMSAINAELYRRGLNSIEQKDAEDLKAQKQAFTADLERKYPAWSDDFRNFTDNIYKRMGQLQSFAYDKQFDNRPDIQGVRQYLALRNAAAQSLDAYAASTGGSRSLQAQENSELRNWFYDQVGQLIQQNPSFGEFYSRYLESDRLERGSGP